MAEVSQAMQLDFQQAMQDFRKMFPNLDADIIEAVLRANKGAVHATIDQLLFMVTDGTSSPSPSILPVTSHLEAPHADRSRLAEVSGYELPPAYSLSATPPPSYHQAVPSPHRSPMRVGIDYQQGHAPMLVVRNWNPPILLPLPNDFLRVIPLPHHGAGVLSPERLTQRLNENALAQEAVGESDIELAQYLKDERVALFLQNDEFICELRNNQEFMNSLQKEYEEDNLEEVDFGHQEGSTSMQRIPKRKMELPAGLMASLDDATLKARIVTMGKVSRKKFTQIAKVFSRSKKSASLKSISSSGAGEASGKDFLISADPLFEDCDEDTMGADSNGRNTKSSIGSDRLV